MDGPPSPAKKAVASQPSEARRSRGASRSATAILAVGAAALSLLRPAHAWPWDGTTPAPPRYVPVMLGSLQVVQLVHRQKCISFDLALRRLTLELCDDSDDRQHWVWNGTIMSLTGRAGLCVSVAEAIPELEQDHAAAARATGGGSCPQRQPGVLTLAPCDAALASQRWLADGCRATLDCREPCVNSTASNHSHQHLELKNVTRLEPHGVNSVQVDDMVSLAEAWPPQESFAASDSGGGLRSSAAVAAPAASGREGAGMRSPAVAIPTLALVVLGFSAAMVLTALRGWHSPRGQRLGLDSMHAQWSTLRTEDFSSEDIDGCDSIAVE
eukprot:TRINITY_DN15341_c0_g1_i1.p1 TRINITY_DN15341_c0_g1~~TRINITY_DN15341_c0_g1_i1.p1  ORF type:complete len:351 (-),score=70.84 TRINITY_DN15341_c0_g1_i1:172-1152(-)